jgi:hypothetical protein
MFGKLDMRHLNHRIGEPPRIEKYRLPENDRTEVPVEQTENKRLKGIKIE